MCSWILQGIRLRDTDKYLGVVMSCSSSMLNTIDIYFWISLICSYYMNLMDYHVSRLMTESHELAIGLVKDTIFIEIKLWYMFRHVGLTFYCNKTFLSRMSSSLSAPLMSSTSADIQYQAKRLRQHKMWTGRLVHVNNTSYCLCISSSQLHFHSSSQFYSAYTRIDCWTGNSSQIDHLH